MAIPTASRRFGLPVVADSVPDFAGPLAGILAGLDWAAAHRPDCPDIVSVPTDAPFLPRDLVARLLREREAAGADLACAASGGRPHPVVGLWPVRLRDSLREAVVAEGIRKVDIWTSRYRLRMVDFPEERPGLDPFFNANRPGDLDRAAELLRQPDRPGGRRGKESRMARPAAFASICAINHLLWLPPGRLHARLSLCRLQPPCASSSCSRRGSAMT